MNQSIDRYRRGSAGGAKLRAARRGRPPRSAGRARRPRPSARAAGREIGARIAAALARPAREAARGLRAAPLRGAQPRGDRRRSSSMRPGDREEQPAPRHPRDCGAGSRGCAHEPPQVLHERWRTPGEPARGGLSRGQRAASSAPPPRLAALTAEASIRGVARDARAALAGGPGPRGAELPVAGRVPGRPASRRASTGSQRSRGLVRWATLGRWPSGLPQRCSSCCLGSLPRVIPPDPRPRGELARAGGAGLARAGRDGRRRAAACRADGGARAGRALSERSPDVLVTVAAHTALLRSARPPRGRGRGVAPQPGAARAGARCWSRLRRRRPSPSARPVLEDVEHVLREVAALEPCARPEDVVRVQQQMEQGRLLMKIEPDVAGAGGMRRRVAAGWPSLLLGARSSVGPGQRAASGTPRPCSSTASTPRPARPGSRSCGRRRPTPRPPPTGSRAAART